jgi:hypothetical protein
MVAPMFDAMAERHRTGAQFARVDVDRLQVDIFMMCIPFMNV